MNGAFKKREICSNGEEGFKKLKKVDGAWFVPVSVTLIPRFIDAGYDLKRNRAIHGGITNYPREWEKRIDGSVSRRPSFILVALSRNWTAILFVLCRFFFFSVLFLFITFRFCEYTYTGTLCGRTRKRYLVKFLFIVRSFNNVSRHAYFGSGQNLLSAAFSLEPILCQYHSTSKHRFLILAPELWD